MFPVWWKSCPHCAPCHRLSVGFGTGFSLNHPLHGGRGYEVVDAIERNDMENLREELGDLLLQVIYHAQMASEEDAFDFGDVVETVTTKMIRRHPHVFGDEKARTAGMAKGAWERIKAEEKAERAARQQEMGLAPAPEKTSLLNDVPAAMPPLLEAVKLQQKASKVGFDWNDPKAVIAKIKEELDEVEAELDNGETERIQDELGDVLFALANLGRHLNIDSGKLSSWNKSKIPQAVSIY